MADAVFNTLVVCDGLPDSERWAARKLIEQLRDIAEYDAPNLRIASARWGSVAEVETHTAELRRVVRDRGVLPALHIEAHGLDDETGLLLPNGEALAWDRLNPMLTRVNIATKLNLKIILAACFGGSFATTINPTDRAPVWGLIGPRREVSTGALSDGFASFYRTFFAELSYPKALQSLNIEIPEGEYYRKTALEFFYEAWIQYRTTEYSPRGIEQRARRIRTEIQKVGSDCSIDELKEHILNVDESQYFNDYKERYFMMDLYPQNKTRFPVSFEQAEKYVERSKTESMIIDVLPQP